MSIGSLVVESALNTLQVLSSETYRGNIHQLGISEEDMELITGPRIWLWSDKQHIVSILNSMLHAATQLQGIPEYQFPAEYVAMFGVMFVDCNNHRAYSLWFGKHHQSSEELIVSSVGGQEFERVEPAHIYALMTRLVGKHRGQISRVLSNFADKTDMQLSATVMGEPKDDAKPKFSKK